LTGLVEEFLRQQANFPASVVTREDWLLGVVAIEQVHLMLYQLSEASAIMTARCLPWPDKLDAAIRAYHARTLGWPPAPVGRGRLDPHDDHIAEPPGRSG
jgi:hypothetical protein